jgi:hypothetical protein
VWEGGIQVIVTTVIGRSSRHIPCISAKEVFEGTRGCCIAGSGTTRHGLDISRTSNQDLGPKESCHKAQVRIFLLLPATLMRVVSGRSRPRRAGFPTGTRTCRLSEEAHSLLGRRACAYRERRTLPQNSDYLLKHILGFVFCKP